MSRFSGRTSRFAISGSLAVALLSLCASAADAAGTSLVDRDVLPQVASGRLSLVVDTPIFSEDDNHVRVVQSGDQYRVTDNRAGVRAQVASGCDEFLSGSPVTDAVVTCPVRDIFGVGVFLRGGNDTAQNATDMPSVIMVHNGNDQAVGGSARDRIMGDVGDDVLSGEGGDDSLDGGGDADVLDGGPGNDELDGGAGVDTLLGGIGADTLKDSPGPDDFRGGQNGGSLATEPVDTVTYVRGTVSTDPPIQVTLDDEANDGPTGDFDNVRNDVERVVGANGADHFTGNGLANVFDGDDGGDLLEGGGAADLIDGGFGADELHGGEGPDTLHGDGDTDVVSGEGGDDLLDGDGFGRGRGDVISGGTGGDTVTYETRFNPVSVDFDGIADDGEADERDTVGADVEHAIGGKGADTLTGNEKFNRLSGGDGDDRITGGLGADVLDGGTGNDTILARDGVADTVTCGAGVDVVDADPIDVLAADCEPAAAAPPAAPAPDTPAPTGSATPENGGVELPGTSSVVTAPRSCPAVRVSTQRARLTRGGALRVRLAGARDGVTCTARVSVGTQVKQVRVVPGRTVSVSVRLSRTLRAKVSAGGRAGTRVTVRVKTVDPAGRVATARRSVRLVAR